MSTKYTVPFTQLSQSCVVDACDSWEEPTYRTLSNGAPLKIVHAFKADGFVPEYRSIQDFWVPQKVRSTPVSRAPLDNSENVILGPVEPSSKKLKRVRTITKRAGKAIVQRRKEDKENMAAAKFYSDFF